ncbi:MAG: PorT family protein [Muribaculaceae bacterium]|nr:PorT family protein [Muribaculaceae bacterium]
MLLITLMPCFSIKGAPRDKLYNRPYADQKLIHLGFSVGAHFQDLSFTHNGFVSPDGQRWVAEVPSFSPGFCVNVLGDLRLNQYLNLRLTPGMYFGAKTVRMIDYNADQNSTSVITPDDENYMPVNATQEVKSAYVVVPLDLKISGDRLGNTRPYVTTGVMASFDVSKKRSDFLMFNPADVYLTVGLGCDFYLPFFKFIPEIKFCFGLTDILKHDRPDLDLDPNTFKITQSLSKVKSNMVVINFYFE